MIRVLGLILTLLISSAAWAEQPAAVEESDEATRQKARAAARAADRDEALAVMKRMSDFLKKQDRMQVQVLMGYDSVQSTGQRLEFGSERTLTVRRPDRLRMEILPREGSRKTLTFDGKRMAVELPDDEAYVLVDKPGGLGQFVDYLTEDLGAPAPLLEFLGDDFYSIAAPMVESGFVVGNATFGKDECVHVALRGEELDFQLWVMAGDEPLPKRVVITYKSERGTPQFWAQFVEWDLSPRVRDRLFEFDPPKGFERIPVRPLRSTGVKEAGK